MRRVAVIDVGKTNVKLVLVDLDEMSEVSVVTRLNVARPGPPWPHFDVEGHWEFLLAALADVQRAHGVDAISITTHGAACVLLDRQGELAAPVLDYEHPGPDGVAEAYDAIRPDFSETGSPRLAGGLNLGAQLHWMFGAEPGLMERTARIVTYPQYWGFRLTGVAATEVTSLGCHTDLWNPFEGRFSSLVDRLGIAGKMAPARASGDVLGPVLPEVAARTGLRPDTPVYCGIHDSNASLLPHVLGRAAPFSVVSTGTWVVSMAIGGRDVTLDPACDTLVNVNALGDPVPSARFMGGREFEMIISGQFAEPDEQDLGAVLAEEVMLFPAVVGDTGPFQGRAARWAPHEPALGSPARVVAASLYLALVTSRCLELIGHDGPVVVEGPFARNAVFCKMLSVASGSGVEIAGTATGTSQGAALLACDAPVGISARPVTVPAGQSAQMQRYVSVWRGLLDDLA